MNVKLNKKNQRKFIHNTLVFLAPLGILYITTIIGVISADNHVLTFNDFIPNQVARGGLTLWILNSILDYLRKLKK